MSVCLYYWTFSLIPPVCALKEQVVVGGAGVNSGKPQQYLASSPLIPNWVCGRRPRLPATTHQNLVVENEALRRKQAETLNADPNLDLSEDEVRRMSEPWWVWVMGLLMFVIATARRAS